MAHDQHDDGQLREAITHALQIADARPHHLIAALLAQCLDEIDRPPPADR